MTPPSPVVEPRSAFSIRLRIQEYLARKVVNSGKIADAYIRYQDIAYAWSGHDTISNALYPAILSSEEVDDIRARLLRFLSILVYIDAHDFLDDFRKHFFGTNETLLYADCNLPLKDGHIPALGSFMLRKRFLDEQYLFLPEVLFESPAVRRIDDQRRLPFESISKDLFAGAYGTVDKVGISPFHFRTHDGGTYSDIKFVACKRFHVRRHSSPNDAQRELDNLQVLKESITSHHNIRLHLAIIHHKGEHLILLPWADHLDLDIFLLGGRDYLDREVYDFKRRFPRAQQGEMISDICTQLHHVAHALKWLHGGITTHGLHRNTICFAHMDLKPNNILIDNDDGPSKVGKWVLTDFGISAFKEDDGSDSSNLVSVRDYYQNLTINTSPRRDPGAYQPPEVEHMDNKSFERRITAEEGSAGRRGDIWSFGCIFAEVLAFSLGQAALVKEFRKLRVGGHNTDYFYEKIHHHTLQPDDTGASYRVRPWIVDWLRNLSKTYTFPKGAIDCCVATILEVLVVDGRRRPKADELVVKINHVSYHVNTARTSGSFPPHCPLDRTASDQPLPGQSLEIPGRPPLANSRQLPSIKRISSIEEENLFNSQRVLGSENPSPTDTVSMNTARTVADWQRSLEIPATVETNLETRPDSVMGPGKSSPPQPSSVTELRINTRSKSSSSTSSMTPPSDLSPAAFRQPRRDLHGVFINPKKARKTQRPVELTAPGLGNRKAIKVSVCPSGERVAYLTELKKTPYEISLYDLRLASRKVERQGQSLSNPIILAGDTSWYNIALAQDYLVAWGNDRFGAKQVYMTNGKAEKVLSGSAFNSLGSLLTVAVSKYGSLAFVCDKAIVYTTAVEELVGEQNFRETIQSKYEHTFAHAAFNDDGTLLYTWEYGQSDDSLSVWRIGGLERRLIRFPDSEGSYQSKQQGSPATALMPYNSHHGCIVWTQGDAFFSAQIRSTQREFRDTPPKMITTIRNTVAACVYGDDSLLVVEQGLRHTRIWQHRIAGGPMHVIEGAVKNPVVQLNFVAKEGTRIRVVSAPGTDELMIILCTSDGKIVIIPVVVEPGE